MSKITCKQTDDTLIASTRFTLKKRAELEPKFEKLTQHCQKYINGPAFVIYHWGTGVGEGVFDIEAGFPVSQAVETDGVKSRVLPGERVLSLVHTGPHTEIGSSIGQLYDYAAEHGLNPSLRQREVYLYTDEEQPANNETELHVILHNWNSLLAAGLERVLGAGAREEVMAGSDQITASTGRDARVRWTCAAMDRLDQLADAYQRYDVVSRCAHVFPQERIARLRAVYQQSQDVNQVLKVMAEDVFWYEEPVLKGNVLHVTKNPFDPQGFEKATTRAAKRKSYCHCSIIKNHLDEMNPTFCQCGAGWYRQLWEGILEKPVRIEMVKALTLGDDVCQFAIHLPDTREE
jgi:effector-binding domain-containing protein